MLGCVRVCQCVLRCVLSHPPFLALSCLVVPCCALPCLALPYPTLPSLALPCLTLPYPASPLPYPALPYPALPYLASPHSPPARICLLWAQVRRLSLVMIPTGGGSDPSYSSTCLSTSRSCVRTCWCVRRFPATITSTLNICKGIKDEYKGR